jgi:hypothetical protein
LLPWPWIVPWKHFLIIDLPLKEGIVLGLEMRKDLGNEMFLVELRVVIEHLPHEVVIVIVWVLLIRYQQRLLLLLVPLISFISRAAALRALVI